MKKHLGQAINHFRGQLRQREAHNGQQISVAHTQTSRVIGAQLEPIYEHLEAKLEAGEKIPLSWLHEGGKLEAIKQTVSDQVNRFGQEAKGLVERAVQWAASLGSQAAHAFYGAITPSPTPLKDLGVSRVAEIAERTTRKLAELFDGFGAEAAHEVSGALVRGVLSEAPVKEIADEVTQKLGVSRSRALTISGTLPMQAMKEATIETYANNEETITGWVWVCQLSKRSCAACVAKHGTVHSVKERFHDHPNGKCQAIPHFREMTLPRSGIDWFSRQSSHAQRAILGSNKAYELYQSGAKLEDFVGSRQDSEGRRYVSQKSVKQLNKERNEQDGSGNGSGSGSGSKDE